MEKFRTNITKLDLPRLLKAPVDIRVRKPKITIIMLHGIGNSAAGWDILKETLPSDARVIALDLLGFGISPKPSKASYNLRLQARSVAMTLLKMRISTKVIIVGHSMGALIATELAKRYPLMVHGLVLCSPPIYRNYGEVPEITPRGERILYKIYNSTIVDINKKPERYITLARRAARIRLASPAFSITKETIVPYVTALQSAIMKQSTFADIQALKMPVRIIYGTLDPFVVAKNFKYLAKYNPHISAQSVMSAHEVRRPYVKPVTKAIAAIRAEIKK